jgi:hypothetical protein
VISRLFVGWSREAYGAELLPKVQAPSNYKDETKKAEFIRDKELKRLDVAACTPGAGRINSVVVRTDQDETVISLTDAAAFIEYLATVTASPLVFVQKAKLFRAMLVYDMCRKGNLPSAPTLAKYLKTGEYLVDINDVLNPHAVVGPAWRDASDEMLSLQSTCLAFGLPAPIPVDGKPTADQESDMIKTIAIRLGL